jgi:hypothetical protein
MKNYIIWSPERGLPTKTHGGLDAATAEASRLATKHPGVPFHVYELLGTCSAHVDVRFKSATDAEPLPFAVVQPDVPAGWRLRGPSETLCAGDRVNWLSDSFALAVILAPTSGWIGDRVAYCGAKAVWTRDAVTPSGPALLSDSDPVPSERPKGWIELRPDEVIQQHDLLWDRSNEFSNAWASGYRRETVAAFVNCESAGAKVLRHPSRHKPATPKVPAPDEVAKGHNPMKLTNAQVGVSEGWRLLEKDELRGQGPGQHDGVEFCFSQELSWRSQFYEVSAADEYGWTYRTKNPPGFYLEK